MEKKSISGRLNVEKGYPCTGRIEMESFKIRKKQLCSFRFQAVAARRCEEDSFDPLALSLRLYAESINIFVDLSLIVHGKAQSIIAKRHSDLQGTSSYRKLNGKD
ncbi:MAG: hypothetical protein HGB00_08875 [Chlorobiaceae bacterium]|nr:hypothetical protein [Chlorobiaceae bacterium]